jgi:multiple sugar transport system permease protein
MAITQVKRTYTRVKTNWQHANQQGDISTAIIALTPAAILFLVFNLYPLFFSGYLSLLEWDGFSPDRQFVGFNHYTTFLQSSEFTNSLKVTVIYTVGVTVFSIALGLVLAVLLNSGIRGQTLYRVLFFLPVVTSTIAVAIVWRYLMTPYTGYVDIFLRDVGVTPPKPTWLRNPDWALRVIMVVGIWKRLGFNIVIYLAGLQGIPAVYYEAARVDGAGALRCFWNITVPLIAPITLLLVIMSIIDSFLIFDVVYVMTSGGPLHTTEVIGLLLYNQAFRYFNMGQASAIAWVIFAIVFAITMVQWIVFGVRGQRT